jgi:hypothetical protein
LAADELRAGFNIKPATGHRIPRRPWSDRSREGAVGSEETIMLDSNQPSVPRRDPWNKGRFIGQKRPLKPQDVWSIRVRLQVERRARNLALFNLAIDSKLRGCDLVRLMSASAVGSVTARPLFRRRRAGRCNSRSPSRPEPRSRLGLPTVETETPGTSFPAGSERSHTCRPGSMRGSSILRSRALGLIARPMARIRCDGPRRLRYIRKRAT